MIFEFMESVWQVSLLVMESLKLRLYMEDSQARRKNLSQ